MKPKKQISQFAYGMSMKSVEYNDKITQNISNADVISVKNTTCVYIPMGDDLINRKQN